MSLLKELIGRKVVEASMETATLTLDNGVKLVFDKENADCCSWVKLTALATTDHAITNARFRDDEGRGEGGVYFSSYRAWIHVITEGIGGHYDNEGGEVRIAEAEGNVGNGYYLHGFDLNVAVVRPDGTETRHEYYTRGGR